MANGARTLSNPKWIACSPRGKELGINLIDTAECYGDHLSEEFIGRAIEKSRGRLDHRDEIRPQNFTGNFNRTEPRTPSDVEKQLDESLRALRTDYVDVLQYHSWGDPDFARQDVRDVLAKLVKSGEGPPCGQLSRKQQQRSANR